MVHLKSVFQVNVDKLKNRLTYINKTNKKTEKAMKIKSLFTFY
jgi:hypothetical protein